MLQKNFCTRFVLDSTTSHETNDGLFRRLYQQTTEDGKVRGEKIGRCFTAYEGEISTKKFEDGELTTSTRDQQNVFCCGEQRNSTPMHRGIHAVVAVQTTRSIGS